MSRYMYIDGTEVECSYFPSQKCDVCEWTATIDHDEFKLPGDFFVNSETIKNEPAVEIVLSHAYHLLSEERNLGLQLWDL